MWKHLTIAALAFDMLLAAAATVSPQALQGDMLQLSGNAQLPPILDGLPVAGLELMAVERSSDVVNESQSDSEAPAENDPNEVQESNSNGSFKIPITAHKSQTSRMSTMAARIKTLQKHMLNVPGKWLQAVEKLPVKEYGYGIEVSNRHLFIKKYAALIRRNPHTFLLI
ncbi:hypothetical protein BX070DRAFT_28343 [Coemansia spiralis]|nr:hypothetical protein BX070DRAFT_28343 [Coemansia spiralis]